MSEKLLPEGRNEEEVDVKEGLKFIVPHSRLLPLLKDKLDVATPLQVAAVADVFGWDLEQYSKHAAGGEIQWKVEMYPTERPSVS